MQNKDVSWTKGDLSKGFVSLAEHLGLDPQGVVFANSLVVDPQGPSKRLAASDDLEGISHQYALALCASGSAILHLPLTPAQEKYITTYVAHGEMHEVAPAQHGRLYPEASIFAQLKEQRGVEALNGRVLANSYVTEDVEIVAAKSGATTLMSSRDFIGFVGKEYPHDVAGKAGVSLPLGVVISSPAELQDKMAELKTLMEGEGMNPAQTKIWIKPTSLSGGQGVYNVPGYDVQKMMATFGQIDTVYRNCGFGPQQKLEVPFQNLDYFMPVVMEADIGAMPGVKQVVAETGVQAVLGPKGIVHVETLINRTDNGEYLGGTLPQPQDEPKTLAAELAAKPLLTQMWLDGYRGYVGVDVMIAEKQDGQLQGYVNEANTRLTGNSPLVGLAHRFSEISGKDMHGLSMTVKFPHDPACSDAFVQVAERMEGFLFRGEKSGYEGAVPVVVDVPPGRGYISCKTVLLADSHDKVMAMRQKLLHAAQP